MRRRHKAAFIGVLCVGLMLTAIPGAAAGAGWRKDPTLYVPKPNHGAIEQIAALRASGEKLEAALIRSLISTPQAVWFEDGTPAEVRRAVRATVRRAAAKRSIPVLVAYNLPYRDCAQYSAGGAVDTAAYEAWIDGFAAGIGHKKAIVILEPDGLGIIPYYKQFAGLDAEAADYEWCQPTVIDDTGAVVPAPEADPEYRFAQLNYAVDRLAELPHVQVYLDGTHSGWLGAGDAAHRLAQAGVDRATGFFLNVSNYQVDERLATYGAWVSKCIWFGSDPGSWGLDHFDWCASQYYPASPDDFSTWELTDQWYVDNVESQTPAYPGEEGIAHFVIDTGRNGVGPWTPPADAPEGDPQDWCNPPDRGAGVRPTLHTADALIDAYLWVKIPGESDGECIRWGPGPEDPVRGIVDPGAGEWFPEMALELAQNANPPLEIIKRRRR